MTSESETTDSTAQHLCRYCKQEIAPEAKVCHHCSHNQNRFAQNFQQIGIIISFLMMIAALWQLLEARNERIDAAKALNEARLALSLADSANTFASSASQQVKFAQNRLKLIDSTLDSAKSRISELDNNIEFQNIILAANNDDRSAYDLLYKYAHDQTSDYQQIARSSLIQIIGKFKGLLRPSYMTLPNRGFYEIIPFNQIVKYYRVSEVAYHADFVQLVSTKDNVKMKDKITFLVEVLMKDNSLFATHLAGVALSKEAGMKWQPFECEPLLEWASQNKYIPEN